MGIRLKVTEIIVAEAFFQCFDRYRAWKPKTFVSLFKHIENSLLQNTDFRFFKISVKDGFLKRYKSEILQAVRELLTYLCILKLVL